MNVSSLIAKHLRDVYLGANWADSNLKDNLLGVSWQQAIQKVEGFNTIAAQVYHIHYFVAAGLMVLRGQPLDAHDQYSFGHPPIQSREDWEQLLNKTFTDAEALACLIEQLPDSKLNEDFSDKKYGSYYRNLHGIIEHAHYHLGQIVMMKKLVS